LNFLRLGDPKLRDLPICGLTNYLWRNKTLRNSIMTSFWLRYQITSPKICHQNVVTIFFHFQPPLSKILVAILREPEIKSISLHYYYYNFEL